jgi:hypothetical protein
MTSRLLIFLVCLTTALNGYAQIFPASGARLTYTQVMFDYEKAKGADSYLLQLVEDAPGASFQNSLVEQKDLATATLVTNLQFGKRYQWRYAGVKHGKPLQWNGPYYFEIVEDSFIKRNIVTLNVTLNDSNANAGGLIVNDATRTAVDRNGKLVWYLSKVNWFLSHTEYTKTVGNIRSTIKNVDNTRRNRYCFRRLPSHRARS